MGRGRRGNEGGLRGVWGLAGRRHGLGRGLIHRRARGILPFGHRLRGRRVRGGCGRGAHVGEDGIGFRRHGIVHHRFGGGAGGAILRRQV